MKFGKNANVRGRWCWIELSDKEVEDALEELLKFNDKQLDKVVPMAKGDDRFVKILADKQLIAAYTYLSAAIDKKIESQKNPQATQDLAQHPMFQKAQQYAERKLGQKAEEPTGQPSLIDKAMEQKDE